MKEVVVVSAVRTPIGSFGGALANLTALDLGVACAKEAIVRAGITANLIDESYIGNVLSAGLGQNIARQIAVGAGIPVERPAMTMNMVCGSGLRSVSLAAQLIASGEVETVLCGGSESMSNAPYFSESQRWGTKMGDAFLCDTMIKDGLTDAFHDYHMGITAENIADKWKLSREEQDFFAAGSQNKAEKAQRKGLFQDEIVAVEIPQRRGEPLSINKDEYIRYGSTKEGLSMLKPAFKKNGTVTAGNASGINDGAAMVIVMSKEKAVALGIAYIAVVRGWHTAGVDPSIMGYGPVPATKEALRKTGWTIEDLDLVEANEAFAAQGLAVIKDLGLDESIVNVNGGAIALGHPIGASGTRILVTLLHEMKRRAVHKGLATLCIGGGMGTSLLVEM